MSHSRSTRGGSKQTPSSVTVDKSSTSKSGTGCDIQHNVVVVVVVCFHDLKFCLSSQVKAASCNWCSSEMPPSKQVNGHSFTICHIVWCSPQSQSGEAM